MEAKKEDEPFHKLIIELSGIKDEQKYIIHHINANYFDNRLKNLFLVYRNEKEIENFKFSI